MVTKSVRELAERLFREAQASGTLKPPRAIGVLARSDGSTSVATESQVTWRNYIKDARRLLNE